MLSRPTIVPGPDLEASNGTRALVAVAVVRTLRPAQADRFDAQEPLEPVFLAFVERIWGFANAERTACSHCEASFLHLRKRGVESRRRRQRNAYERPEPVTGLRAIAERDVQRCVVGIYVVRASLAGLVGARVDID